MLSVILLSMLMILLYSKCDRGSDLWQQLELASELESNLQGTVDWGRMWLVDFNAGEAQLVSFEWHNTGAIDVKLFLRKNHLLRCWVWLSLWNWIGALTLSPLLKLPPRKLEPQFLLWSFFLLRFLSIPINLLYAHVWNTVVTSRLVFLVTSWNC